MDAEYVVSGAVTGAAMIAGWFPKNKINMVVEHSFEELFN